MDEDTKEMLKEVEKLIVQYPAEEVDKWIDAYREYEKEADDPLTFFEWILQNKKPWPSNRL
ncbi:hypothetical protein [Aneurinibacillus terranovensis]|uniref:hypothetical protein n=1 Tax=Aneurinibacillus terranovensis TaxID=278991 RepID=UPI0004064D50|nr:hypothetical protein [Aneurinibacillus terranovensis]